MDYTNVLDDIRDSVQAQVGYQYQIQSDLTVIRAEMEETQEFILQDISGDQEIKESIEKLNTTTSVIAIVVVFMLLYNFIVRSFK